MVYSLKRVHKVVSVLLAIICPVLTIQGYFRLGESMLLYGGIATAVVAGVLVYMNKGKGSDTFKKYFITTLLTVIVVGLFLANGYSVQYHYLFMFILAIGALYFDEKLVRYLGVLVGISFIGIYLINKAALVGTEGATNVFIIGGSMFVVWIALYLLTRWVGKMVIEVVNKEKEASKALEDLQEVMERIVSTTTHIDRDVEVCGHGTEQLAVSSHHIVQAVSEMSNALQEMTNRITTIDMHMAHSLENIQGTEKIADEVKRSTCTHHEQMVQSAEKIEHVKEKMEKIELNSDQVQLLMKQLDGSIEEVNKLLANISGIAHQTNMLALNANIEAARAGESGRGFAVVADSIGKLAKESSQIVEAISKVNEEMLTRSQYVGNQVTQSVEDTKDGKKEIEALYKYFINIKNENIRTNELILRQVQNTQELLQNYKSMQQDMTHITAISEENTATVEEITAIIQEEDSQINHIVGMIEDIAKQTVALRAE